MPTPLEKTEALLEKARTDFENIQAKKADILEKEKQAVARLEKIENTRILQLVNMNKIDSDMLKAILWMLDGARYLWQGEEKSPDSGNC